MGVVIATNQLPLPYKKPLKEKTASLQRPQHWAPAIYFVSAIAGHWGHLAPYLVFMELSPRTGPIWRWPSGHDQPQEFITRSRPTVPRYAPIPVLSLGPLVVLLLGMEGLFAP